MTIFAKRFNICSPKFWERLHLSRPPGCNSGWWLCGFDSSVAIANPQTAQAGHEKTNLAWLAKSATDNKKRTLLVRSRLPNVFVWGPHKLLQ